MGVPGPSAVHGSAPRSRLPWYFPDLLSDGRGNYTLGVDRADRLPRIEYDKVDRTRGMDITFVTTAENDADAEALLDALGFPFKKN